MLESDRNSVCHFPSVRWEAWQWTSTQELSSSCFPSLFPPKQYNWTSSVAEPKDFLERTLSKHNKENELRMPQFIVLRGIKHMYGYINIYHPDTLGKSYLSKFHTGITISFNCSQFQQKENEWSCSYISGQVVQSSLDEGADNFAAREQAVLV